MKLSTRGYATLTQLVERHAPASEEQIAALAQRLTERRCRKGEAFLRAGEQAEHAGIVVEGVQGEFYEAGDGTRKAKWLAGPGEVFGSFEDLVRKGPARATIEALTDGVILCMPYAELRRTALADTAWARFFVAMVETLYRRKSEREYTLLMLRAPDRYRWFREHYGELESRLPQEVIASYLGITPVHLSRVRKPARSRAR